MAQWLCVFGGMLCVSAREAVLVGKEATAREVEEQHAATQAQLE